jgi:hypothetical protein
MVRVIADDNWRPSGFWFKPKYVTKLFSILTSVNWLVLDWYIIHVLYYIKMGTTTSFRIFSSAVFADRHSI